MFSNIQWLVFITIILSIIVIDLTFPPARNTSNKYYLRRNFAIAGCYIAIALSFSLWILHLFGANAFKQYLTAYIVEQTLAIDNLFIIMLIFQYFNIEQQLQNRLLIWGIVGVIIFRGIFIYLGSQIIREFEWVLYIFAAILIVSGIKITFLNSSPANIISNRLLQYFQKYVTKLHNTQEEKFFIIVKSKIKPTKLLIALICIEISDIIFALDSIPAVFAITQNPYIVYTSNIFAILGLRRMYFVLSHMITKLYYLKHSLGAILIFIGTKVFISDLTNMITPSISLIITFLILLTGITLSYIRPQKLRQE